MLERDLRTFHAEVVVPVTECVYARAARYAALATTVLACEGPACPPAAAAATHRDLEALHAMRRAEAAVFSADHTHIARPPSTTTTSTTKRDAGDAVPIGGVLAGVLLRLHNEAATALRHWHARV